MINAKKEFLEHIENRTVEYVSIAFQPWLAEPEKTIKGSFDEVVDQLDFDYYAGYGGQELYGLIWYTDGSWSERGEYDGSEWWEHKSRPAYSTEAWDEY